MRPSRFVALAPEHRPYNVEVDLGAIGAFAVGGGADVLHCDLQSCAGFNSGVILGSGRAGVYRGKYLKGVGRTLLAGNWDRPRQAYHGSGHLLASGAVRELVVTRYLGARGLGDTIVPCEGILLAPLDPRLASFHAAAFPGEAPPPIDARLQAISVKPAGFVRASNLLWLLEHGTPHDLAARFFQGLADGLGAGDTDPEGLAQALALAVERTLARFEAWLRAGVSWGSCHNNLTLDGRFLDLECATILGAPFLGVLDGGGGPRAFAGCEALGWLAETRRTLAAIRARWRFLLDERLVRRPVERDFAEAFLAALDAALPEALRDPLRATQALVERALDAPRSARADLRAALRAHQAWLDLEAPPPGPPLHPLPLTLSRTESVSRHRPLGIDLVAGVDRAAAQELHHALDAVDAQETIEGVAEALDALLAELG